MKRSVAGLPHFERICLDRTGTLTEVKSRYTRLSQQDASGGKVFACEIDWAKVCWFGPPKGECMLLFCTFDIPC